MLCADWDLPMCSAEEGAEEGAVEAAAAAITTTTSSSISDEADSSQAQRQWDKKQQRYNRQIKKRRRAPPQPALLPCSSSSPPVVSKEHRAAIFASWLLRHYGEQMMRGCSAQAAPTQVADWRRFGAHSLFLYPREVEEGGGERRSGAAGGCSVVDVASGRGRLAFYLSTVYRLPVTCIDPRPLDLLRWQTQYRKRLSEMRRRVDSQQTDITAVPSSDRCDLISHLQCNFPSSSPCQQPTLASAPVSDSDVRGSQPASHPAVHPALPQPTVHPSPSGSLIASCLASASLLVGLHPDGATEAIIDYSLQTGKSFAVVPCCVFASHADSRRDIANWQDFLSYLMRKDARIQRFQLPFAGRNVVLFIDPRPSSGNTTANLPSVYSN